MPRLTPPPRRRVAVRTHVATAVAAAAAIAATAHPVAADPQYGILDLGTFGGSQSKAFDINNSGLIVGFADTATDADRAFRTNAYSAINPAADSLGILAGGDRSYAYSINSSGNVAGDANATVGFTGGDRAYRYTTSMQNLGTLGGDWSYAFGINDSGQVVGGSSITPGFFSHTRAFLYSGTQMQSLGTLGGHTSWARSINKDGYVAGYSQHDLANYWVEHAFLWSPTTPNATTGTMIDLGTLGGTYSYAWSINDRRQVVGAAHLAGDLEYHAFRFQDGVKIDLGTLGGTFSEAYDINLNGEIVGASDDGSGETRAFVYVNGTMYNLNDLIPAGSGWVLQHARAINDSGYIVGYGINPLGETRGFLLTPLVRDSVWNVDAGGDWSAGGNWANGVPDGVAKVANFGAAISAPRTVNVDAPYTVGRISFDNVHAYTLAGPSTVTLDAASGESGITVLSGSHDVAVPLVLNDSASVQVLPPDATLTISGSIAGTGANLTKGGAGTLALAGTNTYGGDTMIEAGVLAAATGASLGSADNRVILNGGTLRSAGAIASAGRNILVEPGGGAFDSNGVDSAFGAVSGTGAFTKQSSGTLTVQHLRVSNLVVAGGVLRVVADGGSGGTSAVDTLAISPESQLDLKNNKLIIRAGDIGTFDGTNYSGVQGEVARAYNFGAWDQPGLTTSEQLAGSNAGALSGTTTIAVATAEQILFIGPGETGLFMGQTVTGSTVIAMYTYAGDLNFDGLVDGADYGVIDNYVQFPGTTGYANGDINYDGVIDGADYGMIDNTIQLQGAPFPGVNDTFVSSSGLSATAIAVPEPTATAGLILTAVGISLTRRVRHRGQRGSAPA